MLKLTPLAFKHRDTTMDKQLEWFNEESEALTYLLRNKVGMGMKHFDIRMSTKQMKTKARTKPNEFLPLQNLQPK